MAMAATTTAQKVDYKYVSPQDWDRMPDPHIKPPSPWISVLDALQAGQIVQIAYTDRRDRISKRISLARQATKRGFRTEVRTTETHLAVRKIPIEIIPQDPESSEVSPLEPPVVRRRGRGRKALAQQLLVDQQQEVPVE